MTGNTVIDALHAVIRRDYIFPIPLLKLDFVNKKIILLTAHRRENQGAPMQSVLEAVATILNDNPDTELIFPVHLNPAVKTLAGRVLGPVPRAHLIAPLSYDLFVNLMARFYLVLTDSGGIQEEAPSLGKPVIVFRAETERPEAVRAGAVILSGVERDKIYKLTQELLIAKDKYEMVARAVSPYGDGKASEQTVEALYQWFSVIHKL